MKKIFSLILFTIIILGLTGCGGVNESNFVGKKYMREEANGVKIIYEFKEANVMVLTRIDKSFPEDTTLTCDYFIKDGYLNISYNNQSPSKFKISNDRKILTSIADNKEYKLVD